MTPKISARSTPSLDGRRRWYGRNHRAMEASRFICFHGGLHPPIRSVVMTTLAQDLFHQRVRRTWRAAMNECLSECRRVCLVK
jgi:hypothetical protein